MKKLFNLYIKANIFLFPLFFLPIVQASFTFGKNWFLFVSACLGLVLWLINLFLDKKAKINLGRGLGLFFVFLIWVLISFLRQSPSIKAYSISEPNGLGTFISLFIWYFLWLQSDLKKSWVSNISILQISGIVISLISLVIFVIPESKLPISWPSQNPLISIDQNWSLTGSIMTDVAFFAFLVFESGRILFKSTSQKQKGFILKIFSMSIITLGLILTVYKLTKFGWGGLNYVIGWQITADTFKNSPIFGVGIGNFLKAFNLFRPFSYNLTPFWQDRFIVSSSGFFHYWAELGIGYLIILILLSKRIFKYFKTPSFLPIIIVCLINLIFPPNLINLWLLAFVLSHKLGKANTISAKLVLGENKYNVFPALSGLIILIFVSLGLFISSKKLLSRVYLRKSIVAASQNDGLSVYNNQIKAISYDPNSAELRRVYSQTNLGLAQSLSQNEDLADADKEQISVLLQQSIREAKDAVTLSGSSAIYWTNLASIYKNLIGSVEGAPDWALEAYQQAAVADQADPFVRMEIGSLFYASNLFDNADRYFEEVLLRKPDLANGWYNWAHTAKNMNRLADAINRLNQALLLVPVDSTDYDKANQELTAWRQEFDKLSKQADAQTGEVEDSNTFKTAEPLPTVSLDNQIDIPEEDIEIPLTSPSPTE